MHIKSSRNVKISHVSLSKSSHVSANPPVSVQIGYKITEFGLQSNGIENSVLVFDVSLKIHTTG